MATALPLPAAAVPADEFAMHLDERGLVQVRAFGFRADAAVDRYFTALERLMAEARARDGRARVLVDKRAAPLQSAAVAQRLTAGCLAHHRPADRLAVVVATGLAMLQARRVLPADRASAFVAVAEAERFLLRG